MDLGHNNLVQITDLFHNKRYAVLPEEVEILFYEIRYTSVTVGGH